MVLGSKKGNIEYSIILFGLIFMLLTNISLGYVIDDDLIEIYDVEDNVDDFIDSLDLGTVSSTLLGVILSAVSKFFGLFGVNFIATISILPGFVSALIGFLNALVVVSIVMYLIDKLWIG